MELLIGDNNNNLKPTKNEKSKFKLILKKLVLRFITCAIAAVILVLLGEVIKSWNGYNSRNCYAIDYSKEFELKYWECKSKLVDEVQNYIQSVAPTSNLRALDLVDACEEYSIDIKFTLAQGELESHFGTKGLASKTNSVWNMGAFDGHTIDKIFGKYKYNHPNASIKPYLACLVGSYLQGKTEKDLLINFVNISGKRYASESNYENWLSAKYESIATSTKIDSLQDMVNYYRIRSYR